MRVNNPERKRLKYKMADEEEAPAEAVAVEEVQMSVLDALKEVRAGRHVIMFSTTSTSRPNCIGSTFPSIGSQEGTHPWWPEEGFTRMCQGS